MSDARKSPQFGIGLAAIGELRLRLARTEPGEKRLVFEKWVQENVNEEASDENAHTALTLREIVHEIIEDCHTLGCKKLVLVIHGIRDQGEWMEMVKTRLESADVVVQPIDFEYFDAFCFMTGVGVAGVINRVLAKVRNAKADNEGAELFIIAHSFGTFVISCILRDYPDIRCRRAIFCGSVVPRTFRFDKVPHCPQIVNECGGRDIWPVVAQGFSLWHTYGAAGVWGLRASGIKDRFHDFGHSDYLTVEFVERYWKPYIERDEFVASSYQEKRRSAPLCVSLISYGWRLLFVLLLISSVSACGVMWLFSQGATVFAWGAMGLLALGWIALVRWIALGVSSYMYPSIPLES